MDWHDIGVAQAAQNIGFKMCGIAYFDDYVPIPQLGLSAKIYAG
jgi:hypothetical protein